jgi:hypothetical protein
MARCPECAGVMEYNRYQKAQVCNSCGLSLTRHELDTYWQKIRTENVSGSDEVQQKKSRKKEWLDWYSSSKEDKNR